MRSGGARRAETRSGFLTVELMIALLVGLIVLAGVFKLLISQSRLYGIHRETMDVRETLRAAAALISWELTGAAATGGDLHSIAPNSITLRSLQGTGTICAIKSIGPNDRYGLQHASGYFQETADDSALVYSVAGDKWSVVKVEGAWNKAYAWDPAPSGGGTPFCFWGDTTGAWPRPQATLQFKGDSAVLAELVVGAPVRAFRATEYGLFQQNGRWWVGRRVGTAPSYEMVTGPMLSPTDDGLVFTYYDAAGAVTADRTQVAQVEIALRSESFGLAPGSANQTLRDSLTIRVSLRNNTPP